MEISLELKTQNGDFQLLSESEALLQTEDLIIESDKGKFYNNLLLGVGITKYLNGPPVQILAIKNGIKKELIKDGILVTKIEMLNGEIHLTSYKK
jgi:hypothetical protein